MKVKPFYISTDGLSDKDVAEAIDKCVNCGAHAHEGVSSVHADSDFGYGLMTVEVWKFFGVDYDGCTAFADEVDMYGGGAAEITLNELDEWLGIENSEGKYEQAQEWNGEGLPPAGVECEFSGVDEDEWERCVVYGTYGEMYFACAWGSELKENDSFLIKSFKFRQIETPQQREERERLEAAYDLYIEYTDDEDCYSFPTFCKLTAKNKWLAIVDKTGYRKAK